MRSIADGDDSTITPLLIGVFRQGRHVRRDPVSDKIAKSEAWHDGVVFMLFQPPRLVVLRVAGDIRAVDSLSNVEKVKPKDAVVQTAHYKVRIVLTEDRGERSSFDVGISLENDVVDAVFLEHVC